MALALAALSHAPGFGEVDPGGTYLEEILEAQSRVRDFVQDFDPDVTIIFGPDHFNGVLYEMLPPFCIGAQAEGVGDWGTTRGPLPVDSDAARFLIEEVIAEGVDVARSERFLADHGIVQPLDFVFGKDFSNPVVPVFLNCVGRPLTPMSRVRLLGEAVGRAAQKLDKRVLLMGSGGMSHNPPIVDFEKASPEVRERVTHGRRTAEERAAHEARILQGIQAHASGERKATALNEAWDTHVLSVLKSGDLTETDGWNAEWVGQGGSGGHEIRAWLAPYAALTTAGPFRMLVDEYWAVDTWDCGFAVTAAVGEAR